jgi:hypothetical protein
VRAARARPHAQPSRPRHALTRRIAVRALERLRARATVGTLPFTGFPLWLVFAAGTALVTCGAVVRRRAAAERA